MKLTREQSQDRLEEYFSRRDTPSGNSPVGNAMVRILAKYQGISFEEARTKAHELLDTAAKARKYRGPVVLSAEELAESKNRLKRVFRGPGDVEAFSKASIPGDSSYTVQKNSDSHVVSSIPETHAVETPLFREKRNPDFIGRFE